MDSRQTIGAAAWSNNSPDLAFMQSNLTGIREHFNAVAHEVSQAGLHSGSNRTAQTTVTRSSNGPALSYTPAGPQSFTSDLRSGSNRPLANLAAGGRVLDRFGQFAQLANPISFLASSTIGAVGGIIGSAIQAKATRYAADVGASAINNQTSLARYQFDTEWNAARSVGLVSPAQFSDGPSDYYSFSGRTVNRVKRTTGDSPYM